MKIKIYFFIILSQIVHHIVFSQTSDFKGVDPDFVQELVKSNSLHIPLKINQKETAVNRWLNKPVSKSLTLDNMETTENWKHSDFGKMELSQEYVHQGKYSIKLSSPTKGPNKNKDEGRIFGEANVTRVVKNENWNNYNRLSFYVYPVSEGARNMSMRVLLLNNGRRPDMRFQEGTKALMHYVLVKPNEWNHIVWEIPYMQRDSITGVLFTYQLHGNERNAADSATLYFDEMELQQVIPEIYKGWRIPNETIAYSHTGYQIALEKTAISSDSSVKEFQVIDQKKQQVVLSKASKKMTGTLGNYQLFDFSEIKKAGTYTLTAGNNRSRTFKIDKNPWLQTAWKALNFFYTERCGYAIPGVHGICHEDWQVKHQAKTININGGWHDAGDLSQGLVNTSEAVYSILKLAEKVKSDDSLLYNRLIEEAKWGLNWVLKTRFQDGYRVTWAVMDLWTDGIIGNIDDVNGYQASSSPYENFMAIRAEAYAARVLKDIDPNLAAYCRKSAVEDWQFSLSNAKDYDLELASEGAFAAMELYQLTCEMTYKNKALEFGQIIMKCQQRTGIDWTDPLAGFFYTNQKKEDFLHYYHRSHEATPILVMIELCKNFPDDKNWSEWYATVLLYSEYLKKTSALSEPFSMLAAGVYDVRKLDTNDPEGREIMSSEIRSGKKLDEYHYLRIFPVSGMGNTGTILTQTKAISASAVFRNNASLNNLSQKQLEWHVGKNPFGESLMYGEGYNYSPQYTAMSGDIVGSLPVGMKSLKTEDAPLYPASNVWAFREVWVHPVSRWLWILEDLNNLSDRAETRDNPAILSCQKKGNDHIIITTQVPTDVKINNGMRLWNLSLGEPVYNIDQKNPQLQTVTWKAKITSSDKSWALILLSDDQTAVKQEIFQLSWLVNIKTDLTKK